MQIINGLTSLFIITIPIMFELPLYVLIGFIVLFITTVLYHTFPHINLFRILDTTSVIYVCSTFSFDNVTIPLIFSTLNILEKTLIDSYSSFTVSFIWIYTIIYCTINFNKYTLLPIIFSSFSYYYTFFINNGKWDNMVRLIWHFYNTFYISINVPFRFNQNKLPEIPNVLMKFIKN